MIAPSSAQSTVVMVMTLVSTMPFPMVEATAVPMSAPVRLKNAASAIACRGVRTFVETTVAIAFAASWKPLMYSNAMAASTTMMNRTMRRASGGGLGILEHDLENDVPRVAAAVDHFFEKLVEIAQENDLLGVVIAVE